MTRQAMLSRALVAAMLCPLLVAGFSSCGAGAKPQESAPTVSIPAPPERPAADESARWVPADMPGALALRPSLRAFPELRLSAHAFRGALAMLAYEDGELAAYPTSAIAASSGLAPGQASAPGAAAHPSLPPPIWKTSLGFAAERLLALPNALVAAFDADSGRLLLLSGADGSLRGEVQVGKGSRLAPAWTSGYLAFATDEALEIVRTGETAPLARVPLAARPASSVYSALGRFAVLVEDGSLLVVDAASGAPLWSVRGLDPRGGLACDGEAWYALDSSGSPRAFALSDGAQVDALASEPGSFDALVSVSAEGLRVSSGGRATLLRRAAPSSAPSSAPAFPAPENPDSIGLAAPAKESEPSFSALFGPAETVVAALEAALDKYLHRDLAGAGNYLAFAPWVQGAASGGWGPSPGPLDESALATSAAGGPASAPAFIAYAYLPEGSGERRLSYTAPDEREVLLAVFAGDGSELASNVGELVERSALRLPFEAGRLYWIVAGNLERTRRPGAAAIRID